MFTNYCAGGCGKIVGSYALNKQGDLPTLFCGGVCQTRYNQEKRMADHKTIVPFKKSLSSDELTARMGHAPWKFEALNKECGIYKIDLDT